MVVGTRCSVTSVLSCLHEIVQQAGRIARGVRSDSQLIRRLTEEKSSKDFKDFKTLADVLIQEVARYKLEDAFPVMKGHIYGEENGKLCTNGGEDVHIVYNGNIEEIRCALNKVLENDTQVTDALINLMHSNDVDDFKDVYLPNNELELDLLNLGVWIDPIDGTNVYLNPSLNDATECERVHQRTLHNVTILIGLFNESTGIPVIGFVNQPFHQKNKEGKWVGRTVWGVNYSNQKAFSANLSDVIERPKLKKIASTCRLENICNMPKDIKQVNAAGAGYKGLCVILGEVDLFIGQGNYMWDTCAVQAILNCVGGGMVDLSKLIFCKDKILALEQSSVPARDELIQNCQLKYIPQTCQVSLGPYLNSGDMVAYRNTTVLMQFIRCLK